MPELPEVETVVRGLQRTVLGRTIESVRVTAPPALIHVSRSLKARSFGAALKGRVIERITRRGKNILIALSGDITLWAHLKMTGHFFWLPADTPRHKHDMVSFDFAVSGASANGHRPQLRFNDYRRFGRLRLFCNDELWAQDALRDLGPEPLDIDADRFVALCHRTSRAIKPALLDQTFLAGLGNIYADESLFRARLHPRRLTATIPPARLRELHGHIQDILRQAIDLMGTSVDSYSGVDGAPGGFQTYLQAYGREGEPCPRCGRKIVREKIGSRSAHYCRSCQRPPRR